MPRRTVNKLSPLLLGVLLTSCANPHGLTTHNHVMDTDQLASRQTLSSVKFSQAGWPKESWWMTFGDPQLTSLITEALLSSPDLQVVNAQAEKANAEVIAAESARLPDFDANAGITRSRVARVDDPLLVGKSYSTLRTASISMSYPLDLWGGKKAAWESALGQARASEVDKQAARLTLAANVTRAYNNLALAYTQQELAVQNAKRTHGIAEIQRQYLTSGLTSSYQYKQALAAEKSAGEVLSETQQAVTSAGIRLSVLLGKGPDRWRSLKPATLHVPIQAMLPSAIPAQLLGRRPDIVAARWRVEASAKNIAAVKTEFYPNINLVAEAGSRSLLGDAFFGAPSRFFNVGPSLSLPIFDGGKRRADLASSDAGWDLAVAQYNQRLISALGDISDGITQLQSLEQQISQQKNANELIHSAWDDMNQQFSAGLRPYLDVLSIQNQRIESDEKLAELQAEQVNQAVVLIDALGGGFRG